MKAIKLLVIVLLATITYSSVSATPIHHRRHYAKRHHVIIRHKRR